MSRTVPLRGLLIACALAIVACGGHAVGAPNAAGTSRIVRSSPTGPARVAVTPPSGDWPEFDYNAQRTGSGPAVTGITAANLGRLSLRRVQIDGIADSSAIELHAINIDGAKHDLVAVTTSYGKTIAIDAHTGAKLWEYDPSGVNATPGNPQVTTSSPVVDPDRRYLYAASPNGFIHKLTITTGRQVWSRRITFDPVHEKIASALNISGSWVVAVTGGYDGDIPP
jgi:outer membrane protein assembly factor BamB